MLSAMHGAERQLGASRADADWRTALAQLTAAHAAMRQSLEAAIGQRFAAERAALSPGLSLADRSAALARIARDEAAELARTAAVVKASERAARQALKLEFRLRRQAERRSLRRRQRRERTVMLVAYRAPARRRPARRRRPAIRSLAARLVARPTEPGPAPRRR